MKEILFYKNIFWAKQRICWFLKWSRSSLISVKPRMKTKLVCLKHETLLFCNFFGWKETTEKCLEPLPCSINIQIRKKNEEAVNRLVALFLE